MMAGYSLLGFLFQRNLLWKAKTYRMGFTSRSDKTSFQISLSRCTGSMVAATYMQAGS